MVTQQVTWMMFDVTSPSHAHLSLIQGSGTPASGQSPGPPLLRTCLLVSGRRSPSSSNPVKWAVGFNDLLHSRRPSECSWAQTALINPRRARSCHASHAPSPCPPAGLPTASPLPPECCAMLACSSGGVTSPAAVSPTLLCLPENGCHYSWQLTTGSMCSGFRRLWNVISHRYVFKGVAHFTLCVSFNDLCPWWNNIFFCMSKSGDRGLAVTPYEGLCHVSAHASALKGD